MNPKLRAFLESIGLKANASDADATKFWQSLDGENRTKADGMKIEVVPPAPTPAPAPAPAAAAVDPKPDFDAAIKAAREQEAARVREIYSVRDTLGLGKEWADKHVNSGAKIEDVYRDGHAEHAKKRQPLHISGGEDLNRSSLGDAIADAIHLRANVALGAVDSEGMPKLDADGRLVKREAHGRAKEFRGRSLVEIARRFLGEIGVPGADLMSRDEVVAFAFDRRRQAEFGVGGYMAAGVGMMPGDFPAILGTTVNRTLRQAYMETPSTWQIWARRATAPDFRQIQRLSLSESPDLVSIPSGGGYNYVALSETKEVYALADYGNIIPLGRRAIINDDLNAFSRIPMLQGQAAKRLEDDVAYAPITTGSDGQTMTETSTALFDASAHANKASVAAALTVASLAIGVAAMAKQKGIKAKARLELQPKFLLVPRAIETVALQLIGSIVDPAKSNTTPNPFANRLQVVGNSRLDDDSATAWYLVADNSQIDTVEVCFLESAPAPVLEQEVDFDTDGVKYKVRHTVAARAIDYRGMFKNAGA